MTDADHIAETLRLAERSVAEGGGPFGALVVRDRDGTILGRGANRVTADRDPTAHAEILAVREACRALDSHQLTGCTVYASCEPCPMCLGALFWARPDRIVFCATRGDAAAAGFDDDHIYRQIVLPPAERALPCEQVDHPDRLAPFRAWDGQAGRVDY